MVCRARCLRLPSAELLPEQQPSWPPLQPCLILTLFLLLLKAAGIAVEGHGCCIRDRSMHIEPLHSIFNALQHSRIEKVLYNALQPCD